MVIVLILNWKHADETIRCLDSCFDMLDDVKYIVVDNASGDGSLTTIETHLVNLGKTVTVIDENLLVDEYSPPNSDAYLIQNAHNYGYAGGNNRGLSLTSKLGCDYVWVLNNDTVITKSSLSEMLFIMENNPQVGFVGSVLVYDDHPGIIQACGGGKLYPLLGKAKLYMKNQPLSSADNAKIEQLDYLMGASLLVRRTVMEQVGLMDETYFMYSEEADWQLRARHQGWQLGLATRSIVRHGDSKSTKEHSHMFHFYRNRAAIMFTKKHYGLGSGVMAFLCLSAITLVKELTNTKNVHFGIKGAFEGLLKGVK